MNIFQYPVHQFVDLVLFKGKSLSTPTGKAIATVYDRDTRMSVDLSIGQDDDGDPALMLDALLADGQRRLVWFSLDQLFDGIASAAE